MAEAKMVIAMLKTALNKAQREYKKKMAWRHGQSLQKGNKP